VALMTRRARDELDWPEWFGRRFFDWPKSLRELMEVEEASLRIEEFEDDGTLVVRAEMPGIDPEKDVEITIADHMLHIKAERRQETTTEGAKSYRSEFRYGSFFRSVALPPAVTEADVKASYRDGILEVRVPIDTAKAQATRIPIVHE
jgi:HSP20 family protein